jgi:hypothetical protein
MSALTARLPALSNKARTDTGLVILILIGAVVAFAGGLLTHAPTIHVKRTVHTTIAEQYGKPTQSIDGAQITPALKGLVCDIYQTKATIICHRP